MEVSVIADSELYVGKPATQINVVVNWFEELERLVPNGK
jgi:hypothetical protein